MKNRILAEIHAMLESGELDLLKNAILPFLLDHKHKILKFSQKFSEQNGAQSLESTIKFFILSYNMPFNMKFYLDQQSKAMKDDIGSAISQPDQRQALVSDWIKRKAANYRSHTILTQIACFDEMKTKILPVLKEKFEWEGEVLQP